MQSTPSCNFSVLPMRLQKYNLNPIIIDMGSVYYTQNKKVRLNSKHPCSFSLDGTGDDTLLTQVVQLFLFTVSHLSLYL